MAAKDIEKLKFEWDLYRKSPAGRRHLIIAASLLVLAVVVLVVSLLIGGQPSHAVEKPKADGEPIERVMPVIRGPNDFAREFAQKVRGDPRFEGKVAAVPVLTSEGRVSSHVLIQGVLKKADLDALRAVVAQLSPNVRLEWQVAELPTMGR
ncbi:MAG: hypothetical protein ACKVU4_02885 [Phycisphaerales bacterium]